MLYLLFTVISLVSADQTSIPKYKSAQKIFWKKLYSGSHQSLYCNISFKQRRGMNIEHVFAASWMKHAAGCKNGNRKDCRRKSKRFNLMEADLHNLYPTRPKVNSARGSFPFGEFTGRDAGNRCIIGMDQRMIEPAAYAKGKVARAILYMQHEYNADLYRASGSRDLEKTLLKWHCEYPPTADEVMRNKKIFALQKTSNPYVMGEFDCSKIQK